VVVLQCFPTRLPFLFTLGFVSVVRCNSFWHFLWFDPLFDHCRCRLGLIGMPVTWTPVLHLSIFFHGHLTVRSPSCASPLCMVLLTLPYCHFLCHPHPVLLAAPPGTYPAGTGCRTTTTPRYSHAFPFCASHHVSSLDCVPSTMYFSHYLQTCLFSRLGSQ